ncbi:hypothetical protein FO519_004306 [Halicephalobus sp. NKZ332]|nr:hypothetical protein FO519_004306 [Halicephalobus sp. NKZ332]
MCETADDCSRYVIDLSTPETLERDFYAWLKGENQRLTESPEESECLSSKLPSISFLGEFIGHQNPSSNYCHLSPPPPYPLQFHFQDEQNMSDGDTLSSPAPSSSSGSSFSTNSPVEFVNSVSNSETQFSSNPQGNEAEEKVEVSGRLKLASRFSSTINGRSSGTNQLGRTYSPGLPLSMQDREQIVGLYQSGWKICDISKKLCVTHSCVSKILNRFRTTGSVRPKDAKESRIESPLVTAIRDYRFRLGMTKQSEIREQLIIDGICRRDNVPSRSSINHILRTKLDLKKTPKKKIEILMEL